MQQFDQSIYKLDPLPPLGTCLFSKSIKPSLQSFQQMIRLTLFPYFGLYSFTFFYTVLITFVYCYSLSWQPINEVNHQSRFAQTQFLKVSQKALFDLGQNYPYFIMYKFHYYRMLTSMVLFRNFYHYIISIICILVFCSYIQAWVGFKRVFVLVFTSGVAGQLFGNLVTDQAKLQSSTPVMGLIGYLIGVYVMHRKKQWKDYESQKNHMLIILAVTFSCFLLLTIQYRNLSIFSHLAAFLFGFIFYFSDDKHQQFKVNNVIIIVILCAIMAILIVGFFLYTNPHRVYR